MTEVKVSFGTAEGDKRELNCTKTFTPKFAHLQSLKSDVVVNLAGECNILLISISHFSSNKNHTKTTNKTFCFITKRKFRKSCNVHSFCIDRPPKSQNSSFHHSL